MLNLFGKGNQDQSGLDSQGNDSQDVHPEYVILLSAKARIESISFALKEYFLIYDVYDVYNVLPDDLLQICNKLNNSQKSQVLKCEFGGHVWMWEFSQRENQATSVQLLNIKDFQQAVKLGSGEEINQLNEEVFGSIPASLCVTCVDTLDIIYANKTFQEMFFLDNTPGNISEIVKNELILKDIKSSIKDADQVDNILFVYQLNQKSFQENNQIFVATSIRHSRQIFGNALIWKFEDISSYKILQQQHEQYKKKFNTVIRAASEGIWEWSKLKDNSNWWSQPMFTLLELDADTVSPSLELLQRLMHPKERKIFDYLLETDIHFSQHFSIECRLTVKEKGFRWFRIKAVAAFDANGDLNKLIGSLVNIHAEKNSRLQLQQEKDKAVATLHSIVDAVITTDADGIIEYENSAAERLTGVPRTEMRGKPIDSVIKFYKEHSVDGIENPVNQCLHTGKQMKNKIYADMLDKDGARYTVQVMATSLVRKDGEVFGAVLVLNDVTNIRILSRRLKYQASHDILTKLINRSEFEKRVRNAIGLAHNKKLNSSVLYIDLDRFKLINDICGHAAGDELLKQVAKLLSSIVDKNSSVARMGGDEFAVLMEKVELSQAEETAKKILNSLAAYRFSWSDKSFSVECSIGMAEICPSCDGLSYILNAVDSACYLAKEHGRNCIRKYSEGDDTIIERKGQDYWIQQFDKSLENDSFVLYAQRIISLPKNQSKQASIEVLVRMLDDNGGIIPPNAFLPAVERYDRAYKLDRWIIEKVFQYMNTYEKRLKNINKISINLSGQSMAEDGLLAYIQDKAQKYGVNSKKICFEITETAAIANLTTAIDLITKLKEEGFLFALDDFGSGLSSFAYLKSLPVDFLKIDGIFVKDIQTDKVNYAMVKAIHDMSAVLNKQTIAEYVENEAVVELLIKIGIDYGQGFHLGKPEPIKNFFFEKFFPGQITNSSAQAG